MTNIAEPTEEMIEAIAKALSRHMHDSRARAWDDLLDEAQKDEAREAARSAYTAMRSSAPQEPVADDDALIEKLALALGASLVRDSVHLGECYAWADKERSGEGNILAEVDGEIDLEKLARAAIAELDRLQAKAPKTGEG